MNNLPEYRTNIGPIVLYAVERICGLLSAWAFHNVSNKKREAKNHSSASAILSFNNKDKKIRTESWEKQQGKDTNE